MAEIENKWQQEQEILERKQRALLNFYRERKLPSEEFDVGMALIEKSPDDLTAMEHEIRRLLDELTDGKLSVASYLKSVKFLRQPVMSEEKEVALVSEPKVNKKQTTDAPQQKAVKKQLAKKKFVKKRTLRKIPTVLSEEQVKAILVEKNFYDKNWNEKGKGIAHDYIAQIINGDKIVLDKIVGLMWQQSGSQNPVTYADAEKYIRDLNNKKFAGYNDWRMPKLEESMSLVEPQKRGDPYIDSVFDRTQLWIWTADKYSTNVEAWAVSFRYGGCGH